MSTFQSLTTDQQSLLQNSDTLVRLAVLNSRNAIAAMRVASLDYRSITSAIYASMDSGVTVPTRTGLTGAVPVPKEAVDAMITAFESLLAVWDTSDVRGLHASFVGAANIDGQS